MMISVAMTGGVQLRNNGLHVLHVCGDNARGNSIGDDHILVNWLWWQQSQRLDSRRAIGFPLFRNPHLHGSRRSHSPRLLSQQVDEFRALAEKGIVCSPCSWLYLYVYPCPLGLKVGAKQLNNDLWNLVQPSQFSAESCQYCYDSATNAFVRALGIFPFDFCRNRVSSIESSNGIH